MQDKGRPQENLVQDISLASIIKTGKWEMIAISVTKESKVLGI